MQENVGFALETMAKEIRVSNLITPNSNCPNSPVQSLNISHPVNGDINYFLSGTDLHRRLSRARFLRGLCFFHGNCVNGITSSV